jgi:hypothetical protein
MCDWELLPLEALESIIGDPLGVRDIEEFKLLGGQFSDFQDCFIVESILAVASLETAKAVFTCLQELGESCCGNEWAIRDVEHLELGERRKESAETLISDLESSQRENPQVGRHPTDLIKESVLQPVMMLEVKFYRFCAQILAEVFLGEDRPWLPLSILNILKIVFTVL